VTFTTRQRAPLTHAAYSLPQLASEAVGLRQKKKHGSEGLGGRDEDELWSRAVLCNILLAIYYTVPCWTVIDYSATSKTCGFRSGRRCADHQLVLTEAIKSNGEAGPGDVFDVRKASPIVFHKAMLKPPWEDI
jgi:hypothetical protein